MKRQRLLILTEQERSLLLSWVDSRALARTMAQRARIVLASADGQSVRATARRLGVSPDTVCLWRRRFQTEGLDGLRSRTLPGRPRRIDGRRAGAILTALRARLRSPGMSPGGRGAEPSLAAVARRAGVSRGTVRRLWDRLATASRDDAQDQRGRQGQQDQPGQPDQEDRDSARSPPTSEPGTIVAILLDRSLRLMVRVPARASAPETQGPTGQRRGVAGPRGAAARRPGAFFAGTDGAGAGAILTAFEAFAPHAGPDPRGMSADRALDRELGSLLRRLAHAHPNQLELVGEPWRRPCDQVWAGLPGDQQQRWRLRRARTRGQWLSTVARWVAGAPPSQGRAVAGALGHLTDYLATWKDGSGPFVWTGGTPALPFTPAPGERPPRVRGGALSPSDPRAIRRPPAAAGDR